MKDYKKDMSNYIQTSERAESMSKEYFQDVQDIVSTLTALLDRSGKSAKQIRLDSRQAHAISLRTGRRCRLRYEELGKISDLFTNCWSHNTTGRLAVATRRNNKSFKVCGVRSLDTVHKSRLPITSAHYEESLVKNRYKVDKDYLNKQAGRRHKN